MKAISRSLLDAPRLTMVLILGIGLTQQGWAQDGKSLSTSKKNSEPQEKRVEISDRTLYSEVIFAEIFEKDAKKACNLLEKLLARKLSNRGLRFEAESRYQRLLLSSGQLDRYRAHITKNLKSKDLSKSQREWLEALDHSLRKRGTEIKKRILVYKQDLAKAEDKSPEERESIRKKFLGDMNSYMMSRGRPTPPGNDSGSRNDRDRRLAERIKRAQKLQSRIDKLEKAGKGKGKEAQKLRKDLRRVIQEEDQPRRDPRGGMRGWMRMMRGFYAARKGIEESGDRTRLAEFDKLYRDVRSLLNTGQGQKARELVRVAEKKFPELKHH